MPARHPRLAARWIAALCTLALAAGTAVAWRMREGTRLARAATAFVETLASAQREKACLTFESPARTRFSFVPGERAGIPLAELDDRQRIALHDLLQAALSARGYLQVTGIVHLESILRELESRPGAPATHRDPGRYTVAVFGTPGRDPWGWRFEGHHVSLNWTSIEELGTSSTPLFLGANPARVPSGPDAGWRVMAAEEDLGRELFLSLSSEQRTVATIPGEVPRDVLLGPDRSASALEPRGIDWAALTQPQRGLLRRLVSEFVDDLAPELAAREWARIETAGWATLAFAWSGSHQPGQPHYWRVQGAHFVVEYDDVQNGANHVHTLWRDLEDDFGANLLRRHHEEHHGAAHEER